MDFTFECQEEYLTSEHNERMRSCSYHKDVKSVCSISPLILYLLFDKAEKDDVIH